MSEVLDVVYNVVCMDCGAMFTPPFKSPLWWQAHKRAEEEKFLDALHTSGKKHGCDRTKSPNAPIRVFGYTIWSDDFDVPFKTFTEAVKYYLDEARHGSVVMIAGVSVVVERKLHMMSV